jgi:hypothetical protein
MKNIKEKIEELVSDVYFRFHQINDEELAFIMLESIRITSLSDLRNDFNTAIADRIAFKAKLLREGTHSLRNVGNERTEKRMSIFIDKIKDRIIELLSLKLMNAGKEEMGEFLYDGNPFIEGGIIDFSEIIDEASLKKKYVVSGKLISIRNQKMGNDKDFGYLTLEGVTGSPNLEVLIPTKLYKEFNQSLINYIGKTIGIMGSVIYNEYYWKNILLAYELEIPDGYYIQRQRI